MKRKSNSNKNGNSKPLPNKLREALASSHQDPQAPAALAWNPSKHDQEVGARLTEANKSKARSLISQAYNEWKRQVQRRIKSKTIQTRQDLVKELYALHDIVARETSAPEMFDYRAFCLAMIEDKIGEIIETRGWRLNIFVEFIPEQSENATVLSISQKHTFETLEEFLSIPFLAAYREKVGFIGFVRNHRQIFAFFNDGAFTKAGAVISLKGIDKLPTMLEIEKELAALKKKPA